MRSNRGLVRWFLQRGTAIVLAAGVFVHFAVIHYGVERPITAAKVAARLSSPGWVAFDCVLLLCALFHALNGVHGVILDFNPSERTRNISGWTFWVLGGIGALVGVANLLPFSR